MQIDCFLSCVKVKFEYKICQFVEKCMFNFFEVYASMSHLKDQYAMSRAI